MQLREQQHSFFDTFGYLVFSELFSSAEIAEITAAFEITIREFGGGDHDGSQRTMFLGPIESHPTLCALLDDARIQAIVGAILGADFNYACGDGNYYSGDTGWHADGNWGELFACKIAFYLDPLGRDSGCLRVIPGSQRPDHFIRTEGISPRQSLELYGVEAADFPGNIALETQPGDLVIFNHDLYHASFGGGQRRRMFTMNLTRGCRSADDVEKFHNYVRVHTPGGYKIDTGAGMFRPTLLDTASEARMIHLQKGVEIHDKLFPHLARK